MKYIDWNKEKNLTLKSERGVCFEDVLTALSEGRLLDFVEHPNQNRYKGQRVLILQISDYVYLIPFTEDDEKIFLKTIIPSRKATKKYLNKKEK